MAKSGGQEGNNNAGDGKVWRSAIRRALDRRTKGSKTEAIDKLAEAFLKACDEKEGWAFKELGDRLDGKAVQPISGADGGPVVIEVIKFAEAK